MQITKLYYNVKRPFFHLCLHNGGKTTLGHARICILIIIFLLFVEHEDKRVKAIRKRNKKEQKALRKARATIARNDAKMERRNKKAAKKQRNTAV